MVGFTAAYTAFIVVWTVAWVGLLIRLRRRAHHWGSEIPGAERAPGVIVDVVARPSQYGDPDFGSGSDILHFPVIRFTSHRGQETTFTEDFGTTTRPRIGRTVEVHYDPDNPSRAQIPAPKSAGCLQAFMGLLWIAITVGLSAGAALLWWMDSMTAKR